MVGFVRVRGNEDSHLDEAPDGKWALKNHAKWKVREYPKDRD
jgi:hypothetical protein